MTQKVNSTLNSYSLHSSRLTKSLVEDLFEDASFDLQNLKIIINKQDTDLKGGNLRWHDSEPMIAVKDNDNYIVGDVQIVEFEIKEMRFGYQLFKDGMELCSFILKDNEFPEGLVYVRALKSYFFMLKGHIYRKQVNTKPHYLYIIQAYDPGRWFRCHLVFFDKLILQGTGTLLVLNLFHKKTELRYRDEK